MNEFKNSSNPTTPTLTRPDNSWVMNDHCQVPYSLQFVDGVVDSKDGEVMVWRIHVFFAQRQVELVRREELKI